ncbi:MAG: branched-chain amino acid ABC transporter permease [Thermoleophilaceae bacterium]
MPVLAVDVPQLLASGLSTGAIYAMVGIGFVLIYNVTGIINFAQGEYVMLGALSATTFVAAGVPLPLVLPVALAVALLTGALAERLTIAPARGASVVTLIIITVGVSITLRGLALLIWGVSPRSYDPFTSGPPVDVLGLSFSRQSLWIIGFAVAVAGLLWLFLERTTPGKAMRACAMNPEVARLQGISPSRMSLYAFMLGAAIAGAAGFVFVPVTNAQYDMGLFLGINGFTAAVVGGLVSPLGAVAGGLLLGSLEALAAGLVSSSYESIIAFVFLFVLLVVRPQGLLVLGGAKRV